MRAPRFLPPFWFGTALALIVVLHLFAPVAEIVPRPWRYAGIALAALGFALGAWSTIQFGRAGTTIVPFQESSNLILRGPYRFTRNPIYLGMAMILLGAAVFAGSLSPFLVVPGFVLLIRTVFVSTEEAMLAKTFPGEYAAYCEKVRRWI
jgi:protein-S-isoprenylcysteine O-methyltransferase Ste14